MRGCVQGKVSKEGPVCRGTGWGTECVYILCATQNMWDSRRGNGNMASHANSMRQVRMSGCRCRRGCAGVRRWGSGHRRRGGGRSAGRSNPRSRSSAVRCSRGGPSCSPPADAHAGNANAQIMLELMHAKTCTRAHSPEHGVGKHAESHAHEDMHTTTQPRAR